MAIRRKKKEFSTGGGTGGSAATDIMTSLIGIMILVLIGILLTTVITQAVVVLADPTQKDVVTVLQSQVDGFPEERAFPHGNDKKQPIYLEVVKDKVIIHPGKAEVSQRELRQPDNLVAKKIDEAATNADDYYFVLVIRPGAALLGRQLRTEIRKRGLDVGVDLFDSARQLEHVSKTEESRKQIIELRKKANNPNIGKAVPKPAAPAPAPAATP
jgi:hypothetical protein